MHVTWFREKQNKEVTKGQLISKCLFGTFIAKTERKDSTLLIWCPFMVPHVELFLFFFFGKLTTPKRHFEIN